jgi:hypothetical protein
VGNAWSVKRVRLTSTSDLHAAASKAMVTARASVGAISGVRHRIRQVTPAAKRCVHTVIDKGRSEARGEDLTESNDTLTS